MRGWKAFWVCMVLAAGMAQGRDPVPVYGPARVAVEDEDLLETTILPLGTLAVTPGQIWKVRIGDGLTPGGIPIHPDGCVTNFAGVCVATTNLDMKSWSIKWGPWSAHGDAGEWDLGYGTDETWLRLVRDSGQAYLAYDFTIVDARHYRFSFAWTGDGYDFPVLQVATNLADGYATVDSADVTYSRPDTSHLVIDYAVPGEYVFLSFRVFATDRLSTGAYFGVPIHADYGLQAVGSLTVTGRVESYYDEHAEETRDRYVPGSITIDGEEVATTGAVAAVAADLAAHCTATNNPHSVTAEQVGALPVTPGSVAPGGQRWWGVDDNVDFEGYVAFRDMVEAFAIEATSLKIGAGTCTNIADLATKNDLAGATNTLSAAISNVNVRVEAISADYVTSSDIADLGLSTESWTFILTNGTRVTKSVFVEVAP